MVELVFCTCYPSPLVSLGEVLGPEVGQNRYCLITMGLANGPSSIPPQPRSECRANSGILFFMKYVVIWGVPSIFVHLDGYGSLYKCWSLQDIHLAL